MTSWVQRPWVVVAIVVAAILVLATLSRMASTESNPVSQTMAERTDMLLRAANKWAAQAEQDSNPVVSVMHGCYAKAYVEALGHVMDDVQVTRVHRVSMRDLRRKMEEVQQAALKRLAAVAPQAMPQTEFAVRVGWLG